MVHRHFASCYGLPHRAVGYHSAATLGVDFRPQLPGHRLRPFNVGRPPAFRLFVLRSITSSPDSRRHYTMLVKGLSGQSFVLLVDHKLGEIAVLFVRLGLGEVGFRR